MFWGKAKTRHQNQHTTRNIKRYKMDPITGQYQLWLEKAVADQDIQKELKTMAEEPDKLEDAFYQNLAFGTGGLRGIIGAGTNRMNVYTSWQGIKLP